MNRTNRLFLTLFLSVGLFFELAPSLFAQESETEEFTLEEITVTAQKREENQQKVPIAMEVISADDIQMSGKTNLEEILAYVPNVVLSKGDDGLRITLRGVSDDTTPYHGLPGSVPTVAVNKDGVYSNRKDAGGLFDLERVEVLYGPQSTLYASTSPGGIVNIISASPKVDRYEVSGTIEYGNYNSLHTQGAINAPVSSTMALRAAFDTSVHDGYLSNGGKNEDSKAARLRALFKPNDKVSFLLSGELSKAASQMFGGVDAFIKESDVDDPWYTDRKIGGPPMNKQEKLYANIDLDVGFGTISLVPAYGTSESHGDNPMEMTFGGVTTLEYDVSHVYGKEKSAELRMTSSADFSFKWIFGLNYYDSEQTLDNKRMDSTHTWTAGVNEKNDAYMNEKAKAAFANITYPVTDRFRATVGYRRSWDKIYTHREETKYPGGNLEYFVKDIVNEYSAPDYKLGVEYDLSENSMIYADYSTSYRSQGMEGAGASGPGSTVANPPPEEEKVFTLGSKNRFLNSKLQVNAAAYYYDYKNYSVGDVVMVWIYKLPIQPFDPSAPNYRQPMSDELTRDPGCTTWGDGEKYGVDLDATVMITSQDNVDLSVSYLKSKWKKLEFIYEYDYQGTGGGPGGPPPGGAAVPIEVTELFPRIYTGKPMTNSPVWTITGNYTHIFKLWNGGSLEARVDALFKNGYKMTWRDEDYPYNYQEGYHKIDLSATYIHSDGKWTFQAYVRNIENYADKTGYFPQPINQTHVGDPRTFGAVLSVRF